MTEALAKKMTPARAFRAITAPYRDKMERSDGARGKLEGRLRRAFDLYDEEMREIWGEVDDVQTTEAAAAPAEASA
jgi:hypothetical protein